MLTVLLLGVAAIALFGLFKLNTSPKRHKHPSQAADPSINKTHSFHSVSIVNNGSCCEQIEALSGKRFLSKERPKFRWKNALWQTANAAINTMKTGAN